MLVSYSTGKRYLPEEVDHPLFMPTVDEALKHCEDSEYRGPYHLQLIVEWDLELRQALIIDDQDFQCPVNFGNIDHVEVKNANLNRATLQDCFDVYFREERLGADNAWMCPACKKRQQCIKKLSLWSTPDVFIIHFKRFRQASSLQRTKLSTLVVFPLNGLDMNLYLSNNGNSVTSLDGVEMYADHLSPWQKSKSREGLSKSEDNIYDLYAVCNHHGNMQAGHYTAYCKSIDNRWYSFDDLKVAEFQTTLLSLRTLIFSSIKEVLSTLHLVILQPLHHLHLLTALQSLIVTNRMNNGLRDFLHVLLNQAKVMIISH